MFNQCLDSGKYTDLVQQDKEMAQQMGIQSTPTFLVNGIRVIGAQPFESFQQVVEAILSN